MVGPGPGAPGPRPEACARSPTGDGPMAAARHPGRWGVWVVVSLVLHGLALVLVPAPRRPAALDEVEETSRTKHEVPPKSDGGGDEQSRREAPPLQVVRL